MFGIGMLKKALGCLLLVLGCQSLCAEDAATSGSIMSVTNNITIGKIQLKFEVTDAESSTLGLTKKKLEDMVTAKLAENSIGVTDDPKAPSLLIRFKSVQAAHVIASFIQVAFFEEAELLRGKTRIQAMTWSQATLLTTSSEDFMPETNKTINNMVVSFAQDYKKAFSASSTSMPQAQPQTSMPNTTIPDSTIPVTPVTPATPERSTLLPEQVR